MDVELHNFVSEMGFVWLGSVFESSQEHFWGCIERAMVADAAWAERSSLL